MSAQRASLMPHVFAVTVLALLLSACGGTPTEEERRTYDCPFRLPWSNTLGEITVKQGYEEEGNYSHLAQYDMEYAIDFALPEGTPVLAAREGVVSKILDGETASGGREYANNANFVIVGHEDGTFALYTHLQRTIFTKADEGTRRVQQGEVIGYSGKTGWTNGRPHLHFQLQERGDRFGQSIPLCFEDVEGGVPQLNKTYISRNQMVMVQGMQVTREPEEVLDLTSTESVARWVIWAVLSKDAQSVASLAGSMGVAYDIPYAVELLFPGYNNASEIVGPLQKDLDASQPVCLGYDVLEGGLPDKLTVYFSGMEVTGGEYHGEAGLATQFLFFWFDDHFELVAIGNVPEWEGSFLPELQGCTSGLTQGPSSPIDLSNKESVIEWLKYFLNTPDPETLRVLTAAPTVSYGGFSDYSGPPDALRNRDELTIEEASLLIAEHRTPQTTCLSHAEAPPYEEWGVLTGPWSGLPIPKVVEREFPVGDQLIFHFIREDGSYRLTNLLLWVFPLETKFGWPPGSFTHYAAPVQMYFDAAAFCD